MGITFAARMLMWGAIFGGGDDERGNMVGALAMMILAPIAAALIQMALSRSREYQADLSGAELIGTGEPLARALEKIEASARQIPMDVNPAEATAYIINPFTGRKVQFANLFMHAPADRAADRPPAGVRPHARPQLALPSHPAPQTAGVNHQAPAVCCAGNVGAVGPRGQSRKFVNCSGMPKSLLPQLPDRGLQVVALLALHAQLVALHLVAHALEAEPLHELADLARLVVGDADVEGDGLAHRALGRLLDLAVAERLQRHLALDELLLEHLGERPEPLSLVGVELDRLLA